MKINRRKFEIALAEQCKSAAELRGTLSPATITRIRKGEEVGTKTVGKIAAALKIPVEQLLEQEA